MDTVSAPETVNLELDDIQSGVLHPRPSPYVGTYLLLRIDDRRAGRELLRRLHPVVDRRQARLRPGPRRLGHRRPHLPGPEGARRAPGLARQLRAGVPAGHGGPRGRARRRRREQPEPIGRSRSEPPEVHVALAALSPDAARLAAVVERARRAHQELPGVEVIWRQDCYQLPTGRTSFGFKDGIGQPAVEGSGIPGIEPEGAADQGGRVHPRLPRRDGQPAADADPGGARPQRHLHRVPEAAHPRRGVPAYLRERACQPRGGGAARRQDGRTLAERRATGAVPRTTTIPQLGADPARNNDFDYRRRSARVQVPGRRARAAREPARRARSRGKRQRPPPPHDPARHQLRPDAARRRPGGRRRRPRNHLRRSSVRT